MCPVSYKYVAENIYIIHFTVFPFFLLIFFSLIILIIWLFFPPLACSWSRESTPPPPSPFHIPVKFSPTETSLTSWFNTCICYLSNEERPFSLSLSLSEDNKLSSQKVRKVRTQKRNFCEKGHCKWKSWL